MADFSATTYDPIRNTEPLIKIEPKKGFVSATNNLTPNLKIDFSKTVNNHASAPVDGSPKKGLFGKIGSIFRSDVNNAINEASDKEKLDKVVVTPNNPAAVVTGDINTVKGDRKVDADAKPSVITSIDPQGNPFTVGTDKVGSNRIEQTDFNPDGTTIKKLEIKDKNNKITTQMEQKVEKDGSSQIKGTQFGDDESTVESDAKYDKDGQLTSGTFVKKDKAGNVLKTVELSKDEEGNLIQKSTEADKTTMEKFDKEGNKIGQFNEETKQWDKVDEPEKNAPVKNEEGSLGDIKDKQKTIVDAYADKIKNNDKVQASYNEKKAKITEKYKDNPEKQKEVLEKFDKKFNAKIEKKAQKYASENNEDYKKLETAKIEEQNKLNKFKGFDLKDKDGKVLSQEALSNLNKQGKLFDEDGKPLDRETLKKNANIDMSYSKETLSNNPQMVLNDKNATDEEKSKARMSVLLKMMQQQSSGGAQGGNPMASFMMMMMMFDNDKK